MKDLSLFQPSFDRTGLDLNIDNTLKNRKQDILAYFRERASESLEVIRSTVGSNDYRGMADAINKAVTKTRDSVISSVRQVAEAEKWKRSELLETVLIVTYCSYVVMIDNRNEVWPYDYMAFSRRIGELWEPFCKLCFDYPINNISPFIPPLFSEVKRQLVKELKDYIATLPLDDEQRSELIKYYEKVWTMVDAGQVQLELDLHFVTKRSKINVDFKSGFGSNEKGNTNRLLLVASIYSNLPDNYKCVLLVRSEEDTNNNYFKTLKNSGIWEAHCGSAAYDKIYEYSGYDLKSFVQNNVDWDEDFTESTTRHFAEHELGTYLKW
ncbi:MAG: hypothetical protein P4L33_04185 [Capsulimonadaceae bacterium]|nr:hypothetical protein [Capsulimonadaceae bacterium]